MDWNEETISRLRAMWAEGLTTAEIGRRLGVTKNAVVGKSHRLMLPPRPSPIRRAPAGPAPLRAPLRAPLLAPRQATGPTLPPLPHAARIIAAPRPALQPVPATPRLPVLRGVPAFSGTRLTACCWPIGEPGTPSFRFCDDGAMAGKPYCTSHAALAYVKVRDRREDAA